MLKAKNPKTNKKHKKSPRPLWEHALPSWTLESGIDKKQQRPQRKAQQFPYISTLHKPLKSLLHQAQKITNSKLSQNRN